VFVLMYTVLDDQRQAKFLTEYIESHPEITLKEIIQNCVVSRSRLKYLQDSGYITLPQPMPLGLRNGLKLRKLQDERRS
jgi:hypothetical protein